MPQVDLSLDELRNYRAAIEAPPDLRDFWDDTLAEARDIDLDPVFTPITTGLVTIETFDVTFRGFGGHPIQGWLHLPAAALRGDAPLPAVVQFQGYNGGRGLPHEHTFWAAAGYAHFVMDTRGQGSGWTTGVTGDPVGAPPAQPGFLTKGIEDPSEYFYRRVYTDAVRAIDLIRSHPLIDADRVVVTGHSQGGGITIAMSALAGGIVGVMPDVPFLCDFGRGARIAAKEPYLELARYLKAHRDQTDRAFQTLAYFDGAVLAQRATVPALFSVALMDQTCPPSTVFAAYNVYAAAKDIAVYEFNDHEGGEAFHHTRQMDWLTRSVTR